MITLETGMARAIETSLRNAASRSDILPLPHSSTRDSMSSSMSRVREKGGGPPQSARRERNRFFCAELSTIVGVDVHEDTIR